VTHSPLEPPFFSISFFSGERFPSHRLPFLSGLAGVCLSILSPRWRYRIVSPAPPLHPTPGNLTTLTLYFLPIQEFPTFVGGCLPPPRLQNPTPPIITSDQWPPSLIQRRGFLFPRARFSVRTPRFQLTASRRPNFFSSPPRPFSTSPLFANDSLRAYLFHNFLRPTNGNSVVLVCFLFFPPPSPLAFEGMILPHRACSSVSPISLSRLLFFPVFFYCCPFSTYVKVLFPLSRPFF